MGETKIHVTAKTADQVLLTNSYFFENSSMFYFFRFSKLNSFFSLRVFRTEITPGLSVASVY